MPCETSRKPNQSLVERKVEIRESVGRLSAALATGRAKAIVGPTGGVAFTGWEERNRVTDACAFRLIMSTGSALAKAAIARAEMLAGRSVDKMAVAHGHHSHDGGASWHHHK